MVGFKKGAPMADTQRQCTRSLQLLVVHSTLTTMLTFALLLSINGSHLAPPPSEEAAIAVDLVFISFTAWRAWVNFRDVASRLSARAAPNEEAPTCKTA